MPDHSTPVPGLQTVYQQVLPPAELVELTKAGIELWRPVVGSDGWYDVSNLGHMRTWVKNPGRGSIRRERRTEPKLLTPQKMPKWGYWVVTLRVNGRQVTPLVHCLIAEAFIGPRPGNYRLWQASHADDDPDHNTLANIRWATAVANSDDQKKNRRRTGNLRPLQELDGVPYYQCTGCKEWKPKAEFGPITGANAGKTACGVLSKCRPCSNVGRRKYKRN